MLPKKLYLVYVPVPNTEFAESLMETLFASKLIACANLLPAHKAYYTWQGETKKESEHLLLLKTTKNKLKELERVITSLHPYDCPCILSIKVQRTNPAFLDWVNQEVENNSSSS